ncbi:SDR family NAD(P)-dependent oxidoreductase [uncultured Rhodoblastus sp.]|uniref:SDR family NAD(P)-dependent oxidoreductase n=1 Tax=uncultured Rhodoblastus sp. TaxID=543037 RepID=UPI0025F78293|nr:SDR family NAD(P)-dependent oxidoreductase [uncultured Rhodoblastus sp.]
MNLELEGKRALVTGSSAGIGEAIARAIAAEGATAIVHGRNAARANAVGEAIRAAGGKADVVLGDLSTEEGAAAVGREALASGPVDILVNNAGSYDPTTWDDATSEAWIKTYESDVVSAFRLTQALMPGMRERGWGRIIFIGSASGWQPMATQPQYCAAKGAMLSMTVSLARHLRGTGVTSNIVTPGLIDVPSNRAFWTEMNKTRHFGDSWEEIEKAVVGELLPNDVGLMGKPEDLGAIVAFLASPLSRFVSGANWRVDGGSTLSIN